MNVFVDAFLNLVVCLTYCFLGSSSSMATYRPSFYVTRTTSLHENPTLSYFVQWPIREPIWDNGFLTVPCINVVDRFQSVAYTLLPISCPYANVLYSWLRQAIVLDKTTGNVCSVSVSAAVALEVQRERFRLTIYLWCLCLKYMHFQNLDKARKVDSNAYNASNIIEFDPSLAGRMLLNWRLRCYVHCCE